MIVLRWIGHFEAPWRDVGYMIGWLSVLVGLAGVLYHLESRFFLDRTLKSLTYAAPFAAPLAYARTWLSASDESDGRGAQRRVGRGG